MPYLDRDSDHRSGIERPTGDTGGALTLVALLVGEPGPLELYTLEKLGAVCSTLHVVRGERASDIAPAKRLRRLVRDHGISGVLSRLAGRLLIGNREARRQRALLDRLFDGEHLRAWWKRSGARPIAVPSLNHADARAAIAALSPDIIVRVSGGILKRGTFSLARLATLNIHHGRACAIRGMWSIPWGIIEGRREWIGATVHVIDDGIDTGQTLWCGAPQIAPGDTGDTLFFRAHLQAVSALIDLLHQYRRGETPLPWTSADASSEAVYRSAPGMGAWCRYLYLGRGKRAPVILEAAVRC